MPDIRDIVGQTSALEKIPSIDLRNQEIKAAKQAIGQIDQNAAQEETVKGTKETEDKTVKKEQEGRKREQNARGKRAAQAKEEESEKSKKEIKSIDIIEVAEGKIIDVKV